MIKRLKKWFTLIEMLIVIIIIGILALKLIPKVSFWNVISTLEIKQKLYGSAMVNTANEKYWLKWFSKEIFWSETGLPATKPAALKDLILKNSNKSTTAVYYKEYARPLTNVLDVLNKYCSTVEPKYVPDISTYITPSLGQDKDATTYSTLSKYDAVDLICNLKSPMNWFTKTHVIWIGWNATLKDSQGNYYTKNVLVLLSK